MDLTGWQAVPRGKDDDLPSAEIMQPRRILTPPEIAQSGPILMIGAKARQPLCRVIHHGLPVLPAQEIVYGSDPEDAFRVLLDPEHFAIGCARLDRVGSKNSISILSQAVFCCARPEIALPIFVQRGEAIARNAWGVAAIEDREAHAIKADQPIAGRYPKIPVAGLQQRVDRVLWQPVIRCPRLELILRCYRTAEIAKQEDGQRSRAKREKTNAQLVGADHRRNQ